eukprot:scaffold80207_cov41-Prasinocladus_malaysianus.AAC.1
MASLRTNRHNSTLRLLLDTLAEETGGRWPTIATDCGNHPTWEFLVTSHNTSDSLALRQVSKVDGHSGLSLGSP